MYILGLDPGIEKTGFAVMEVGAPENLRAPRLCDYGCIFTEKKFSLSARLTQLSADLKDIIKQWKPQAACLELLNVSLMQHLPIIDCSVQMLYKPA